MSASAQRTVTIQGSTAPWERRVAASTLVSALVALPLPAYAQGPEIASTLAVGAVVTLVGVRWGIALLSVTSALLLATLWPVVLGGDAEWIRWTAAAACLLALPAVWAIGRAAPHALELFGVRPRPGARRAARRLMVAAAVVVLALPLL